MLDSSTSTKENVILVQEKKILKDWMRLWESQERRGGTSEVKGKIEEGMWGQELRLKRKKIQ